MPDYKHPGVYVEEIPSFPPSIAAVETAIPVFIGYTEKAVDDRGDSLTNEPKKIRSLFDFERFYGKAKPEENITVTVTEANNSLESAKVDLGTRSPYLMYYAMQFFFANGGGDCWVVSVGDYSTGLIDEGALDTGLQATRKINEITLIVFPDAQNLSNANNYYGLYKSAIDVCVDLQDRFTVMDVWLDPQYASNSSDYIDENVNVLRNTGLGADENDLKYGASYFPNLKTTLNYLFKDADVNIAQVGGDGSLNGTLAALKSKRNDYYFQVRARINDYPMEMPPSPAMVGIYTAVDASRGVWKAPANVSMNLVIEPTVKITDKLQDGLNVDALAGKSVNVIREFPGRGILVWGARTLAGNSNDWRYISVRRFFNMVEESTKNATMSFVFEPNDVNTWTRVKSMIENFLVLQWKAGALQGSTPEAAFRVSVGLGETMSQQDILEGRMIIEIAMAVVRPAEFIILRFSHKMITS